MDHKSYVSLHVHTTFSLLDGISRREDLVKKAKEFEMPAVAITEHGNLHNAISFYKQCTDAGIKPIIGMETYVAPDSRFGRTYTKKGEAQENAKNGDLSSAYYHLTLLAKNRTGYENLKQLSTLAYREGFYYKPRIDDEILTKYKDGLIVLSGCLASRTSRLIVAGNQAKALEEIDRMRNLFGEDFYLEVMDHNIEEEEIVRNALIDFGKIRGIGIVMTGDSHYTEQSDSLAHEVILAIGTGKNIQSAERWTFPGSGYWFKSPQEMYTTAETACIPEHALTTTLNIAQRVDDYGFSLVSKTKKSIIPSYRDELGNVIDNETCHELLYFKTFQGLCTRGLGESKLHRERLEFELNMIRRKDFSSYFLIIADIVDAMGKRGIIKPIGRGSSMGSLVCYCTYITGLDPIEHNLPFSRFINEGRKDLPDIDTDISKERRKEVIEYIVDKYGKDRVAQIVTFQSMAAKGAADDVGRGLGVPSAVRKSLGKLLGDLSKDDRLEEVLDGNKTARELMAQTPDWIDVAKRLEGNNRNLGEHAAGIVISNDPIINHVPLLRDSKDGHLVTQYDMRDLGELGLLKLDMLGLRTLDLIQKTINLVNERYGQVIDDYQCISLNDAATYTTVAETKFVSVFQYDSPGIRATTKALRPECFNHLVALNALYRPGPLLPGSGSNGKSMVDDYIERRHGREPVTSWHTNLDKIFADTFGIALYQEQIMELSKILGGFNDEEADEYRAAIGKKDAIKFKAVQEKLVQRGIQNGYSKEFMDDVTRRLAGSARYNWNRGHSVGYSFISYVTAWLETHYPTEYYTTLLNVNLDDSDQLKILLSSILQKGVKLQPPHINNSQSYFHTDGKNIYMGLYSIRQLGEAAVEPILKERVKNGPYVDYLDFCIRMAPYSKVTKLTKENLVKAGAFNWDPSINQKSKVENTEVIQRLIKKFQNKLSLTDIRTEVLKVITPWPIDYLETERLELEKGVLNFYISSHPVMQYQPLLGLFPNINFITPSQLNDQMPGTRAILFGVVEQRTMKTTKNNDPFLQLRIADHIDGHMINIWSPLATRANTQLLDNQLAFLVGQVKEDKFRPGDNQLNVSAVFPILAKNGIPISSFYAQDVPTANRIMTILNATGTVSEPILHQGCLVILSSVTYLRPEDYSALRSCGRANYALAI